MFLATLKYLIIALWIFGLLAFLVPSLGFHAIDLSPDGYRALWLLDLLAIGSTILALVASLVFVIWRRSDYRLMAAVGLLSIATIELVRGADYSGVVGFSRNFSDRVERAYSSGEFALLQQDVISSHGGQRVPEKAPFSWNKFPEQKLLGIPLTNASVTAYPESVLVLTVAEGYRHNNFAIYLCVNSSTGKLHDFPRDFPRFPGQYEEPVRGLCISATDAGDWARWDRVRSGSILWPIEGTVGPNAETGKKLYPLPD